MNTLRTNPLPPQLTAVTSLSRSLAAIANTRNAMLPRLHGYPIPAHVLAFARKYLSLDTLNDLKTGIVALRDCARYASEALASLSLIKIERYSLDSSEIQEWISRNAASHGYSHLNKEDLAFVTYLITAAEVPESSWALELSPLKTDNLICQLNRLYNVVTVDPHDLNPTFDPAASSLKFGTTPQLYYVPTADPKLTPLTDIIFPSAAKTGLISSLLNGSSAKRSEMLVRMAKTYASEAMVYQLADIRLLDHIVGLLLDTEVWALFITPRVKSDPSQNIERLKGLELLAGYLQALLMYPHFFRYELFKHGYEKMEAWHGSLPTIPENIIRDYERLIAPYDFLGGKRDAAELIAQYEIAKDPNMHTNLHLLPDEIIEMFGVPEVLSDLNKLPDAPPVRFSDLAKLRKSAYDHMLLSLPVKRVHLADTVAARLAERTRFEYFTRVTVQFLTPGYVRFYNDDLIARLSGLGIRAPFGWHGHVSMTPSLLGSSAPSVESGSVNIKYNAIWSTTENELRLQTQEMASIFSASYLILDSQPLVMIDKEFATYFRNEMQRDWVSFYPANMILGTRVHDPNALIASPIEVKKLLEDISLNQFSTIKRLLNNPVTVRIWATFLSSFALLFHRDEATDLATVIDGDGMPYGVTYEALAALQSYKKKTDLIAIPDTDVFMGILRVIPLPGDDLHVGTELLNRPYYFYPPAHQTLKVTALTMGPGLLHMGLRPFKQVASCALYGFDKLSAYRLDTLGIQIDPSYSLKGETEPNERFPFSVTAKAWRGDKVMTLLNYKTFGPYIGRGQATTVDGGVETKDMNKLMDDMMKDVLAADQSSRAQTDVKDGDIKQVEQVVHDDVSNREEQVVGNVKDEDRATLKKTKATDSSSSSKNG